MKRPIPKRHSTKCVVFAPMRPGQTGRAAEVWFGTPDAIRARVWTPPSDHEGYARLLERRGESSEMFLRRTADFYVEYPPLVVSPAVSSAVPAVAVDHEYIHANLKRRGTSQWPKILATAGLGEAAIARLMDKVQWRKDHADELEAEIVRRWGTGGAPSKTTKKVIKAVKKKI